MRISIYSIVTIIISTILLLSCAKDENVASKLTSVVYKGVSQSIRYDVVYNGNKIVRFGNSEFTYDTNGRIVKEVYKIGSTNPDYVSGTPIAEVSLKYSWDDQGRLSSSEVIANSEINPASIFHLYPIKRYSYLQNSNTLNKIEYFSTNNELRESTKFHTSQGQLDSIVVTSIRASTAWNPPGSSLSRSTTYYNLKIKAPNPFQNLFQSIGFVPRDLSIAYQGEVLLPYAIQFAESQLGVSQNDFILGRGERIEKIKSSYKRNIDSVFVLPMQAEYEFNY